MNEMIAVFFLFPAIAFGALDGRPCAKLVGISPVATRIGEGAQLQLPTLHSEINRLEVALKDKCIYWLTHKQDGTAIANLRSGQVDLASKAKKMRTLLKSLGADVKKARSGAEAFEMKECGNQLDQFQARLQAEEAKLPTEQSYKCE